MRHVGLVLSALLFVVVAMHCGTCACVADNPSSSLVQRAELRSLERRIDNGDYKRMRNTFPEGGLFTLSFTGFAIANMAVTFREGDEFRDDAVDEIAKLLALSEAERDVAPFSSWGSRAGRWRGVILEGHQNLLRAAYVVSGGTDAKIIADFHATSQKLADMFARAPSGALESFWGRTWYVDNAVALESLRMHDALYATSYGATSRARFTAGLRAHVDKRSGMPASEVSLDGVSVKDGPRGCALSWLLAFQPDTLDAQFRALAPDRIDAAHVGPAARETHVEGASNPEPGRDDDNPPPYEYWQRYRRDWMVDVAGMTGFREYPPWRHSAMDVDSGPIVDGIGAAASAFGVAAARANGDDVTLGNMELPLTLLTAPALTFHGDVELLFGQVPIADAISLWARTITPWDEATRKARPPAEPGSGPIIPFYVSQAFTLGPTFIAAYVFWRNLRRWRRSATTTTSMTTTTAR